MKKISSFLLFIILLSSCSPQISSENIPIPATNTSIPTTTLTPYLTLTATSTIAPTSIANVCSHIEKQNEPFKMPLSWETLSDIDGTNWEEAFKFLRDFELSVVHYLSFHGTYEQLVQELTKIEGVYSLNVKSADLDLDGEEEIIIGVEFRKNGLFF